MGSEWSSVRLLRLLRHGQNGWSCAALLSLLLLLLIVLYPAAAPSSLPPSAVPSAAVLTLTVPVPSGCSGYGRNLSMGVLCPMMEVAVVDNCCAQLASLPPVWVQRAAQYERAVRLSSGRTPIGVLIDGREDEWAVRGLNIVLQDALRHLPPAWAIHVFLCSSVVAALLQRPWFAALSCLSSKLRIHVLPAGFNLTRRAYNQLTSEHEFWARLPPATHVHLFESDAGYCANSSRQITDYLQYDFCGGRWHSKQKWCGKNRTDPVRCIGNSGFSLWSRPAMVELTARSRLPELWNVDNYWTTQMRLSPARYRLCPPLEADRFSMPESDLSELTDERPIGWHKPDLIRNSQWTPEKLAEYERRCPSKALMAIRPQHYDPPYPDYGQLAAAG